MEIIEDKRKLRTAHLNFLANRIVMKQEGYGLK